MSKPPKTIRKKARGVFVAGHDLPEEIFRLDWTLLMIHKWQREHGRNDYEIRPIIVEYKEKPCLQTSQPLSRQQRSEKRPHRIDAYERSGASST